MDIFVVAAAIRYHAHGYGFERFNSLATVVVSVVPCEIAHDADDSHISVDRYGTEALEFVYDVGKVAVSSMVTVTPTSDVAIRSIAV